MKKDEKPNQTSEGRPGKEPENGKAGTLAAPTAITEAQLKAFQKQHCAEMFAAALLQNPKIDVFLYGSPLDGGQRGEHQNAGALLAAGAARLAADYLAHVEAMHAPDKPVPVTAAGQSSASEGAEHSDDFPLD